LEHYARRGGSSRQRKAKKDSEGGEKVLIYGGMPERFQRSGRGTVRERGGGRLSSRRETTRENLGPTSASKTPSMRLGWGEKRAFQWEPVTRETSHANPEGKGGPKSKEKKKCK